MPKNPREVRWPAINFVVCESFQEKRAIFESLRINNLSLDALNPASEEVVGLV